MQALTEGRPSLLRPTALNRTAQVRKALPTCCLEMWCHAGEVSCVTIYSCTGSTGPVCLPMAHDEPVWGAAQVVAECSSALQWLQDKQQLQAQLRPTDDPVLVHTDINKKNETLSRVCHPITSKPAPPPPAVRLHAPTSLSASLLLVRLSE